MFRCCGCECDNGREGEEEEEEKKKRKVKKIYFCMMLHQVRKIFSSFVLCSCVRAGCCSWKGTQPNEGNIYIYIYIFIFISNLKLKYIFMFTYKTNVLLLLG